MQQNLPLFEKELIKRHIRNNFEVPHFNLIQYCNVKIVTYYCKS